MLLKSGEAAPVQWSIRPAQPHQFKEIISWIAALAYPRELDEKSLTKQLLEDYRREKKQDEQRILFNVGFRNGELVFYFNGYHTILRPSIPGRRYNKKDYSIVLVMNTLLKDYQGLYEEVWTVMLKFVFDKPMVARIVTEVSEHDMRLKQALTRLGFQRMEPRDAPSETVPWFACRRTDFAAFVKI